MFRIELPSLRDRRDDIPALARQFARQSALKIGKRDVTLSPDFEQKLRQHGWKGNIRELKNVIERAVILADGPELTLDLLPYDLLYAGKTISNGPVYDLAQIEENTFATFSTTLTATKPKPPGSSTSASQRSTEKSQNTKSIRS
ncbi:hypothetical protein [Larkinella arboricola]